MRQNLGSRHESSHLGQHAIMFAQASNVNIQLCFLCPQPLRLLFVPFHILDSCKYLAYRFVMAGKQALIVPALKKHTATVIMAHGLGDRWVL